MMPFPSSPYFYYLQNGFNPSLFTPFCSSISHSYYHLLFLLQLLKKESTSPSGTSLPKGFFRLSLNSSGRVKTDLSLCKITEHPHLSAYLQSVSSRLGKPKNRSHI